MVQLLGPLQFDTTGNSAIVDTASAVWLPPGGSLGRFKTMGDVARSLSGIEFKAAVASVH